MNTGKVRFVGIKINYDARPTVAEHLKYSHVVTKTEYDEYLSKFEEGKAGGWGFHECLNFFIPESGEVKFYLPPTSRPATKYLNDEFIFFSFTYQSDPVLPSRIVGVHANAKIVSTDGILRTDVFEQPSSEKITFHATSTAEFSTLLVPPLDYSGKVGIYTPPLKKWGNSLRYLHESHARRIIEDAFKAAKSKRSETDSTLREVVGRELHVLENIKKAYFPDRRHSPTSAGIQTKKGGGFSPRADRELGERGEYFVYERERRRAREAGIPLTMVEWTSRVDPHSKYDIQTARVSKGRLRPHYLEVKSTIIDDGSNVQISARQVKFLRENKNCSSIVLVIFHRKGGVKKVEEITLNELLHRFDLEPSKFRLVPKIGRKRSHTTR